MNGIQPLTVPEIIKAQALASCEHYEGLCWCIESELGTRCAERGKKCALILLDDIREPSEAMIEDVRERIANTSSRMEDPIAEVWRTMIDAQRREIAAG